MSQTVVLQCQLVLLYSNRTGVVQSTGVVHRHTSPSGDFEDKQGVWNIDLLHPGQDMELFGVLFWNRKSRLFSREAMVPFISSSNRRVPCQELK